MKYFFIKITFSLMILSSCADLSKDIDLSGTSTNCNRRYSCTKFLCKDYYYGTGCTGDKKTYERWFTNKFGNYDR